MSPRKDQVLVSEFVATAGIGIVSRRSHTGTWGSQEHNDTAYTVNVVIQKYDLMTGSVIC